MRSLIQREKVGRGGRGGLAIKGMATSVWRMCGDAESDVTEGCGRIRESQSGVFSRLVKLGFILEVGKDDKSLI